MSLDSRRIKFLLCGSDYCERCVQRAVCTSCSVSRYDRVCHVQCARAGNLIYPGSLHTTPCRVPHVACVACDVCITCEAGAHYEDGPFAVCIPCSLYQCTPRGTGACSTCPSFVGGHDPTLPHCAPQALCASCSSHYTHCLSCSFYALRYDHARRPLHATTTTTTQHLAPGRYASRAVCTTCSAQHVQCYSCTVCFTCSLYHVSRPPTALWQCTAHHVQCAACTVCITCNDGARVVQCWRTIR